jgi:hypothetical protein
MMLHTRSALIAVLGEPSAQGNLRDSEMASTPPIGPADEEAVLVHRPVSDREELLPGLRHNLVWYCSGQPDVFANCYATGHAETDEWVLRNTCARHKHSF